MISTTAEENNNEKDSIKTSFNSQLGYGTATDNDTLITSDQFQSTQPFQSIYPLPPIPSIQSTQTSQNSNFTHPLHPLQHSFYYSNTYILSALSYGKNIELYDESLGAKFKLKRFSSLQYIKPSHGLVSQVESMGLSRQALLLLDTAYHQQAIKQLSRVDQWNFDIFSLENNTNGHSLIYIMLKLFERYDWARQFQINVIDLFTFIKMVEEGYHSANSYHNCIHAADVIQAMHCNIQESVIRDYLSAEETMASIIAAACHDLDHPGVNQAFLVTTQNPLALLYDETSVLENHHYRITKRLLHQSHLLCNVPQDKLVTIDEILHHTILATDIFQHKKLLNKFENEVNSMSLNLHSSPEDRNFVLQMALKCADICNPCRNWPVCYRWSEMICNEFFRQGDCELKLGFPVTPTLDRSKSNVASIQIGFTSHMVQPLFKLWDEYVSSDVSLCMLNQMRHNKDLWTRIKSENVTFSFQELYLSNQNNSSLFLCPPNAGGGGKEIVVEGKNDDGVVQKGGCLGDENEEGEAEEEADVWQVLASKRRHSVPLTSHLSNQATPHKTTLNLVPEYTQESASKEELDSNPPDQLSPPIITHSNHSEDLSNESNATFLEMYKASCRRSSFPLNVSLSQEHGSQLTEGTTGKHEATERSKEGVSERDCSSLVTFLVSGFISSLYISTIITDTRQRHSFLTCPPCLKGVLGFGVHDRMRKILSRFVLPPSKSSGTEEHSKYSNHLLLLTNQLVASNLLS